MRILKVPKSLLQIDETMPKLKKLPRTYVIIDSKMRVYVGSSFIHLIPSESVICFEWSSNSAKLQVCREFERATVEEESERYLQIAQQMNEWVRDCFDKTEQSLLEMDAKEYHCVSESNFVKPPEYNFKKASRGSKKKKEKEEEESRIKLL